VIICVYIPEVKSVVVTSCLPLHQIDAALGEAFLQIPTDGPYIVKQIKTKRVYTL